MLHKSNFLQKLSCQKPYWDHARLSSLVNKQAVNNQHLSLQYQRDLMLIKVYFSQLRNIYQTRCSRGCSTKGSFQKKSVYLLDIVQKWP